MPEPEPTALITGCSSGIGHATAAAFARDGWRVYATDPDPDEMVDLVELGCETLKLDVTAEGDAMDAIERIDGEAGRLDFLFNNAGYGQPGPIEEVPTADVREQFEVNFFGQHRVTRAALPIMRRQGGGRIVFTSSVFGRTTFIGQGVYASSKWALEGMADTLRSEVRDDGIDVILLEPGPVETEFGERALDEAEDRDRTGAYGWFDSLYDDRRFIDRSVGYIQPEDVADLVLEIAHAEDPKRRYVAGPWRYRLLAGTAAPISIRSAARDAAHSLLKRVA